MVDSQGTLTAPNYYFVFKNGAGTVTPAGTFTITATSNTVTLQAGQNIQTTLTLTPINFYQGTVTLSCGQVPANVSCMFTPATYVFPGADFNLEYANPSEVPISGTLTVNTLSGSPVASSLAKPSRRAPLSPIAAGLLLLPGSAGGVLLFFTQETNLATVAIARLAARSSLNGVCRVSAELMRGHPAVGSSRTTAPGTYSVTIQGTGTTPTGYSTITAAMNLKVVVDKSTARSQE